MMKKIALFISALIFILAVCACNKSKDSSDPIVATWGLIHVDLSGSIMGVSTSSSVDLDPNNPSGESDSKIVFSQVSDKTYSLRVFGWDTESKKWSQSTSEGNMLVTVADDVIYNQDGSVFAEILLLNDGRLILGNSTKGSNSISRMAYYTKMTE